MRTCNIHSQTSHFAVLIGLLLEQVDWEWQPLKNWFGYLLLLRKPFRGLISKLKKTSKMRELRKYPKKRFSLAPTSPEISGDCACIHTCTCSTQNANFKIAQAILKLRNTWTSVPVVHQGTVHDHADWWWWSTIENNEVFLDISTFAVAIDIWQSIFRGHFLQTLTRF